MPTEVNERWSLDFVHDQLADGCRIRNLNIVDDSSRKCVGQLADTSISGVRLVRYLDELAQSRPRPKNIVMHNGLYASTFRLSWASERLRADDAYKALIHGQSTVLPSLGEQLNHSEHANARCVSTALNTSMKTRRKVRALSTRSRTPLRPVRAVSFRREYLTHGRDGTRFPF